MAIISLTGLGEAPDSLQFGNLPIVIHGPILADITLMCYGKITPHVVEAAEFLNSLYPTVMVNAVQVKQADPLPVSELRHIFKSMKYVLLIESDVHIDLQVMIQEQVGVNLQHRYYCNPSQPRLESKIISQAKEIFFIV